jgi:hypothetical protein
VLITVIKKGKKMTTYSDVITSRWWLEMGCSPTVPILFQFMISKRINICVPQSAIIFQL